MTNNKQTELKNLQKENKVISKRIYTLLKTYMMSDEVEDTMYLISRLIENELQQEELCNK